jgi:hypothetical protein
MSIEMTPKFNVRELSKVAETFPKAGSAAMNRIARDAKTAIVTDVTGRYNIKKSDISTKITIVPSTPRNLVARIRAAGRRLTVHRFNARESGMAHGTVVTIVRGQSKVITGAFIQKVNGMKMVLKRKGDKRYPIDAVRTISVPEMVGTKTVGKTLNEFISAKLPGELKRLIDLWGK